MGNPLRSGWYKRAFETAPVGMCFADPDFKLVEVNKALCTMLSYSPGELVGKTVMEISHPDDVSRSVEKMQKLFLGKSNTFKLEKRYLTKDGDIVWGLTTVSVSERGENGEVKQSFAVVQDITTRKRLENKLKESENNYHTMIETAPDAVAVHKDGKVVFVNSAGVRLLGATRADQIVGKPTLSFVHPDSLKKVTERIEAMAATGKSAPLLEEKFLRLDGEPVDVEVVATPVTFQGEKAIQVIVHDISESKKIRDELRNSEARYRNLAEAANDMIFTLDRSGTVTYLNSFAAATFRKKPEDFIGKNKANFFGEEISNRQDESIAEVYRTGKPVYRETQTPFGTVKLWISTWLVPLRDNGEITGILGVSRDISQLKTVAEKLAANEKLLSRAQEVARLGVYDFDVLTGRWQASILMDKIFGIDKQFPHNVEGWLKVIHPDHQAEMYAYLTDEVIGKKKQFDREYRIVRPNDGVERWVHGMGDLEIDKDGRVIRMIGTIQDITERKEVEKMRDEFMMVAAHELRAPMTAIKWLVSMIVSGNYGPIDEKLKSPLVGVSESVSRLIDLVNDMINISRIESGHLKLILTNFDIKKLLDGVVLTFGPEITKKGLTLDVSKVRSLMVRADVDKTTQIISNLVDNAIKFTDSGMMSIATSRDDGKIKISVSDTGVGIPEEFLSNLFGKFSQVTSKVEGRPRGTGLGLYISRQLAREMQGELVLERTELGKGSSFVVSLPSVGE